MIEITLFYIIKLSGSESTGFKMDLGGDVCRCEQCVYVLGYKHVVPPSQTRKNKCKE